MNEIRSTRRMAMSRMGMTTAAAMLPLRIARADKTRGSRVAAIVHNTIGIDAHNHIDVQLDPASPPGPAIDLGGELIRSGLLAICMTLAVDYAQLDRPGLAYQRFLAGITAMDAALQDNGMQRALTLLDLHLSRSKGRPCVVQAVEGCHFLEGRIERLAEAHTRGLRHLGLLHDNDAEPALGDVYTNAPRFGGLSAFGQDVVIEANRLGMLVDMAHGSAATVRAALALSATPVLISHTGLNTEVGDNPMLARMMAPRLIESDLAREVARAGGVIGVWTHFANTPADYAHHVRAMIDVVGIDHVCIGTDTKLTPAFDQGSRPSVGSPANAEQVDEHRTIQPVGMGRRPVGNRRPAKDQTNGLWPQMRGGFYYAVVGALLDAGFSADEIGRIGGGNYLRIFDAATRSRS